MDSNLIVKINGISLMQAVEAMEVQDDEDILLQRALAANFWRHKVIRLLGESPKPMLRALTKALKEVMALPPSIFPTQVSILSYVSVELKLLFR